MSEKNDSAKALVSEILSGFGKELPNKELPAQVVPAATPPVNEAEANALIDVYFELDEPTERDVLFDQITAIDLPVITEFLSTMMEHDEDEYVRAAAAAELARRGNEAGLAELMADLEEPEELYFFEHAVQALAEIQGPRFYDTVRAVWRDPERDADERREAMLGMEAADPARAMTDFVELIKGITDVGSLPDDQLEVALLAFSRHEHAAAVPVLTELRERILATAMDPDERAELAAFVQEGIDLLIMR